MLRDDIAERYLRGALSAADQEAFERHYFECARCFGEVENLRTLGEALVLGGAAAQAEGRVAATRSPWIWAAAATVAALLAGGLYLRFAASSGPAAESSRSEVRVAEHRPAAPGQPALEPRSPEQADGVASTAPTAAASSVDAGAAARTAALAELAIVEAPRYTPAVLRGALDEAARRFRAAMQLYVDGDYDGANAGLREAARLEPERPDIAFFLGVSALLTDELESAAAELRRTLALGESPYLEEASFYLAKAHLRRGDLAAAASELEETVRLRGEREQDARQLLDELEALMTRP